MKRWDYGSFHDPAMINRLILNRQSTTPHYLILLEGSDLGWWFEERHRIEQAFAAEMRGQLQTTLTV